MPAYDSPCSTQPALFLAVNLQCDVLGTRVFDIPQLRIGAGVTWISGGEGRGKTSLLRILAGVLTIPHSELQICGHQLAEQPGAYRQEVAWFDPHTVEFEQVVMLDFFQASARRFAQWDNAVLQALIGAMGLQPHAHKPLYMLSTGTKRKVWLCAALASGAPLTLLDEPFAALDKASIGCVLDFLKDAAAHRSRAWVVADYLAPAGVPLAQHIDLGD